METKKKECEKSSNGRHQWIYPLLEDSIDKNRGETSPLPYCKYCFETITTKQEELSSSLDRMYHL